MSYISKKGRRAKSITATLRETISDIQIIEERIGARQLKELIDNFVPVLLRYSVERGISFCSDHDLLELTKDGLTPKEILFEKEWKNQAMLEDLLDFLTSQGIFRKKGREYHSIFHRGEEKPEPFGLQLQNRKWIEDSRGYKVGFTLYDRIISQFIPESIKTGSQPANMSNEAGQLGPLMDSYYRSPSFMIPRMGAIAAAFNQTVPAKILDLNCGTGRGMEEILLFNPNAEIIGATDNLFYLRVAERNLEVFAEQQGIYPRIEWRVVGYSQPLTEQLEDLVGDCDMILVNQLFQFHSQEDLPKLGNEILRFLKPGGVVAFFQHFREASNLPWPHEWFYHTIQGFSGIPTEERFRDFFRKVQEREIREVVPLGAYLVY